MPQHHETRNLPYTPAQLFDLVAGIELYPEFLPWCKAVRILEKREDRVSADLIVGTKMFREKFTSVVALERPHKISVRYLSGPLSHLQNDWVFAPDGQGGCHLSFDVAFDFKSSLLRAAMDLFFDKAILKMVTAFEARAAVLYSGNR